MRLSILHSTSYTYDEPVNGLIQSLKLIPSIHEGQKIIEWDIKSSIKGIFGSSYKDGAGDIVQTFSTEEKVKTLDIITKGIVETNNQYGILKDYEEEINPNVYLRNTKLTKPNSEIIKLSKMINPNFEDLLKAHKLSDLIAEKIEYITGSSTIHQSASDIVKSKKGVCQDFSHLMISCSTYLNIPARYVTGYLVNSENLSEIESTHAWTEIFMKDLGWVGFDPTNKCCTDDRYIRLCSGLDSISASPIRGVTRNPSLENLDYKIEVRREQQ